MTAPKVFISYSHDSETHKARVAALSKRLRSEGVDCTIDEYEPAPAQGWTIWMQEQVERSDFVLVVCTETYNERAAGRTEDGHGVRFESSMLVRGLYDSGMWNERLIPVLLDGASSEHIPLPLRDYTHYSIGTEGGYEKLYRRLTGQPSSVKPKLGKIRKLPPVPDAEPPAKPIDERLDEAYETRLELEESGQDTTEIRQRILNLKREQRKGRLKVGDFLADGRYRLLEKIGKGGFAQVWKAFDRRRKKHVAVKVLHQQYSEDKTRLERFARGAARMEELREHEHIVSVLDLCQEDDDHHFFVMEYVKDGDFQQAVKDDRLSLDDRWRIIQQVGDALQFAHEKGIIHRDVKPANILIDADLNAKLTDFDLVRAAEITGGTRTGAMGTFVYAAPEMLQHPQDAEPTVDVYGLGMTAIFALYGRDLPPHVFRDARQFLTKVDCSDSVAEVLLKAVEWEVEKRWPTVSAFCGAVGSELESAIESRPPEQSAISLPEFVESGPAIRTGENPLEDLFQWIETKDGRVKLWRTIPADSFLMGSPTHEKDRLKNEGPQHRVEILHSFQMACVPVTQEQFRAFPEP